MRSPLLGIFFLASAAHAAEKVPDFEVRIQKPEWRVEARPPAAHHFNLKAPVSAEALLPGAEAEGPSSSVPGMAFKSLKKSEHSLLFEASGIPEGSTLRISLFLCDDAKTYCIKKVRELPLRATAAPATWPEPRKKSKKDAFGFFVDAPDRAIAEAKRRKLPLLIEFYGIWCPPCNLYSEKVFPAREFRKLKRRFVLLKLDADRELSFALKSRFRVGGYPTWIAAEPEALSEIGRVAGYLPAADFSARVLGFLEHGPAGIESRIAGKRGEFLQALKEGLRSAFEKKELASAERLLGEALVLAPGDADLELSRLELRLRRGGFQFQKEDQTLLEGLFSKKDLPGGVALRMASLLIEWAGETPKVWIERSGELLDLLETRVDANSGFWIPGLECSLADLKVLRMERARALQKEPEAAIERKAAIEAYRRMASRDPDSRAIHLEWAALLVEDGQWDPALAIYERFIRKYPKEFTFYHAAARVFIEKKEWRRARELQEKAFELAYGDHRIRAMDRLLLIMKEQGEGARASERGRAFLETVRLDPALEVRTGRYVQALKDTLETLQQEKL